MEYCKCTVDVLHKALNQDTYTKEVSKVYLMFQSNAEELRQAVLRATQRAIASNIVRHNQVTRDKSSIKLSLELHIAILQESTTTASTSSASGARGGRTSFYIFALSIVLFHKVEAMPEADTRVRRAGKAQVHRGDTM